MARYIDDSVLEEVRDRVDIVDLISSYVNLEKSGANYKGLCPFHNEKTPSFTVSGKEQFYHCFGCGAGGDSIEFIIQKENLNFIEAVEFIASKYGIEIREETREEKSKRNKKDLAFEINREAAKFFLYNLSKDKVAQEYLKKRDINYRLSRKFGLGYAMDSWDSLYRYLVNKGYNEEFLEELGLIAKRKNGSGYYDRFRNRIIFPIIDTRSRVVGFGGRVLDDSLPKYLNSKETITFNKSYSLYGINMVDKYSDRKNIILVEGYMDVISMHKNGINSAVASLGTAFTDRQAKMLKRYGENVYLCYDSDDAGIRATNKAILTLLEQNINPKIINLGDYNDPDDFFQKNNKEDFEILIKSALNFIDYKIFINKMKYDLNSLDGKIKFTKEVAKELSLLQNPIEREVYIEALSDGLNIDKDAIKSQVNMSGKNVGKKKSVESIANTKKKIEAPKIKPMLKSDLLAEIGILRLIILDKKHYIYLDSKDIFKYFNNPTCIEVLGVIKKIYKVEDFLDKDNIYDIMQGRSNINQDILNLILVDKITYTSENIPQMIEDLIKTLRINYLNSKRRIIRDKIEKFDKGLLNIDNEEFVELLKKLNKINEQLDSIKY